MSETSVLKDSERRALLTQAGHNRNGSTGLPSVKGNTPKVTRGPISLSPAIREYNRVKPKYKLVAADNQASRQTPNQRANRSRGKTNPLNESLEYPIKNDKNFKINPRMIGTAEAYYDKFGTIITG
jgi:hypothetical protein